MSVTVQGFSNQRGSRAAGMAMPSRIASRGPLLVTAAYLASAFGWRTLRQWGLTGDTGIRVAAATPHERLASGLIGVGVLSGLAAVLGDSGVGSRTRDIGISVMAVSTVATVAAQLDMGSSWRIGVDPSERTDLVTSGAFRLVRNPIFTAMSTFAIGVALAVPSRLGRVGAAALIAGIEAQVRTIEEPYLRRAHGEEYLRYGRVVGRFVPRVGLFG